VGGDADLVQRAKEGDREAFDGLAESCRPWLFGLCYRLVRDRTTAEDLVQETLLRALRDLAQLRDPDRFRPWLARIAVNACRMELRRLLARPEQLLHVEQSRASAQANEESPFGSAQSGPFGVDEALAQLNRRDRRLLLLFYGDGLSQAEIGEALALSAAAVKSRLHRARERLRKEMLAMMSDEEKARLGVTEEAPWALRTILLVEPDRDVQESLRKGLEEAGYEVVVLPTGEAALAAIRDHRGQMLILDKHCGEPNWVEVLTLVQVDAWSRENVPVCALVDPDPGESDVRHRREILLAWQAGATLCLTRPPKTEELVGFVKHLEETWPRRGEDGSAAA